MKKQTVRLTAQNDHNKKMSRFASRFAKFGYEIRWKYSRPEFRTYHVDDHNRISPIGEPVNVEVVDVEISFYHNGVEIEVEHALKVNEDKVIGHIDYLGSEEGKLLSAVQQYGDDIINTEFRTRQYCDHCHTNRQRNRTYIVKKSDRQLQIGSTCVEVYFGVSVPFIEVFSEFFITFGGDDEEPFGGCGRGAAGHNCEDFIELCVGSVLKCGYVNRTKAEELGISPTGSAISYTLCTSTSGFVSAQERRNCMDAIAAWKEAAEPYMEKIKHKIEEIEAQNSEELENFTFTCVSLIKVGFVPYKYVNYIAGFVCRLVGDVRKQIEQAENKHLSANVGDRVTFKATVKMVKVIGQNYYSGRLSTKYLLVFRTPENEVVKSFYSGSENFKEGQEATITGTVMEHCNDRYGIATMISRIRVA